MATSSDRALAAVLFTDMVGSTALAEELGDRRWKALVNRHHAVVRRELKRFGGRELDTAGDGFFAGFKEPASAISCACAVADAVRELGIEIRAGVHFGECEQIGKKLGGITVVVASRIMSLGSAGEVLISSTASELTRGAGFGLDDRGQHELKGVEGSWRVFAVTSVDGQQRAAPADAAVMAERRAAVAESGLGPRSRGRTWVAAGLVVVVVVGLASWTFVTTRSGATDLPSANSVSRIDPDTEQFAETVAIPGASTLQSIAYGGEQVWVADVGNQTVTAVDTKQNGSLRAYGTSSAPTDLAYEADQLWVTYGFSSDPQRRIDVLDPGKGGLAPAPFSVPDGSFSLAAGDGVVWVADPRGAKIIKYDTTTGTSAMISLPSDSGPVDLAAASDGQVVWVASGREASVYRIDTGLAKPDVAVFGTGGAVPSAISVAPDGSVWIASQGTDAVLSLSETGDTRLRLDLGSDCDAPTDLLATTTRIWVTCGGSESVVALNSTDGSIATTLKTAGPPVALALDPEDGVWVAVAEPT